MQDGYEIARIGGSEVIVVNGVGLKMLVLASAASAIDSMSQWNPDANGNPTPTRGSSGILAQSVNWASHGFSNAIQEQVALVYGFQKAVIERKQVVYMMDVKEAHLIARCLEEYQAWKEEHIRKVKIYQNCPYFGDATGFNRAKWNENNETFLALWNNVECPKCGGSEWEVVGRMNQAEGRKMAFSCGKCGTWAKGKTAEILMTQLPFTSLAPEKEPEKNGGA
jgi:hypothetical protein